jgi:hypothetical protein
MNFLGRSGEEILTVGKLRAPKEIQYSGNTPMHLMQPLYSILSRRRAAASKGKQDTYHSSSRSKAQMDCWVKGYFPQRTERQRVSGNICTHLQNTCTRESITTTVAQQYCANKADS